MLTYLAVIIMVGFAVGLGAAVLFMGSVFRPRNPYGRKLTPWECGMEPVGEASEGLFRVHYFVIAILWAVILTDKTISVLVFVEMFIFIVVLAVGLVYAWAKGALEWV
jgi:NADH-quinone oxidoreductase subunit A